MDLYEGEHVDVRRRTYRLPARSRTVPLKKGIKLVLRRGDPVADLVSSDGVRVQVRADLNPVWLDEEI